MLEYNKTLCHPQNSCNICVNWSMQNWLGVLPLIHQKHYTYSAKAKKGNILYRQKAELCKSSLQSIQGLYNVTVVKGAVVQRKRKTTASTLVQNTTQPPTSTATMQVDAVSQEQPDEDFLPMEDHSTAMEVDTPAASVQPSTSTITPQFSQAPSHLFPGGKELTNILKQHPRTIKQSQKHLSKLAKKRKVVSKKIKNKSRFKFSGKGFWEDSTEEFHYTRPRYNYPQHGAVANFFEEHNIHIEEPCARQEEIEELMKPMNFSHGKTSLQRLEYIRGYGLKTINRDFNRLYHRCQNLKQLLSEVHKNECVLVENIYNGKFGGISLNRFSALNIEIANLKEQVHNLTLENKKLKNEKAAQEHQIPDASFL